MIKIFTFLTLFLCTLQFSHAQVNFNANTQVPAYHHPFEAGSNMGFHGDNWTDEMLANIAAGNPSLGVPGAGVRAVRPALFEWFLDYYGYDIRVSTFEHYSQLGMHNNTVFLGYPSQEHRDLTLYCQADYSHLFANLYEDIWDGGLNGTPINENNYFAYYVFNTVYNYGKYVKFWEIWNEPDVDLWGNGYLQPGEPNNHWDNIPDPCEYPFRAPVFHYIRMLRIAYDVIKTLDPNAYVAVGGVGYTSFVDVICRLTDNPVDGSVTPEYPLTGGAYFDVLSYHSYPHFDNSMRYWDDNIPGFAYNRNSDAAAKGVIDLKEEFQEVLYNRGYDGVTYPEKLWIITESNVPRVPMQEFLGGEDAQINFTMKALIECQRNDIKQFYIYNLAEDADWDNVGNQNGFNFMGLYQKLEWAQPYDMVMNNQGVAYKTTSDLLYNYHFDEGVTNGMNIPDGVKGIAFSNSNNEYIFGLWAETTLDKNEYAEATYQFPSNWGIDYAIIYEWDYATTNKSDTIDVVAPFELTGRPIFIKQSKYGALPIELLHFSGVKKDRDVELKWITASETNNEYWDIEHSIDKTNFVKVGLLPGAGTTTDAQYYSFIHDNAVAGNNYYRLKQVDNDGAFNYSHIINVPFDIKDVFVVNPSVAAAEISIEIYEVSQYEMELEIFDILGRKRHQQTLTPGEHFLTHDISGYDPGHYFVSLKIQGVDYFTTRFIKTEL